MFFNIIFIFLNLIITTCWYIFYNQYSLFKHYLNPYFAFDKIPGYFDSSVLRLTIVLFILIAAAYIAGFYVLRKIKKISNVLMISLILLLIIPAILNIVSYPVGALDIFNYISESKIFYFYHQNPYIIPFETFQKDPLSNYTIFSNLTLVYGPFWLLLSGIPFLLVGFGNLLNLLISYKIFSYLCVLITGILIYFYEQDQKLKWPVVYLFLANPFILFEAVTNAHNDIIMTVFLIASFWLLKKRSWSALPFLILSSLVKYFAFVLVPLFLLVMLKDKWNGRSVMKSAVVSTMLVAVFYIPLLLAGSNITNFVSTITSSLNINTYSIFSLIREYLQQKSGISSQIISAAWLSLAALFLIFVFFRLKATDVVKKPSAAAIDILLLFMVLLSLLQPWYLIPVLALFVIDEKPISIVFLFVITFAGLIFYPLSVWAWFNSGLSVFNVHLFQSLFITLPIILYFVFRIIKEVS